MYAREIDDAASRLDDLRQEEWGDLALAGLAVTLSLLATQLWPPLAMPLFVGGMFVATRGVGAAWKRAEIVDGLTVERDAYVIEDVRQRALREATTDRRRLFATYIRMELRQPPSGGFGSAAAELEKLASELEDETLTLDPACAVACERLVRDPDGSPLLNAALGLDMLRSRVGQIRSGFVPR